MAYTNDMQTLADISGSGSAALQSGIQNDAANQEQQIKNETLQGQQAAEIQKPGLQNLFTQSQTANENAVGQQNQQKADLGAATLPGAIGATNAANQESMTASKAKSLQTFGTIAGQAAGILDSVPPAARPAAMAQLAQRYGVDAGSLPDEVMQGDPDVLRGISQKAIQASSAYQEQLLKGGQEFNKAVTTTGQLVGGRQGVAETSAGARTQAAQIAAEARTKNIQNVVGQLTAKVAAGTATQQERDALDYANKTIQLQRSGNPFAATLTGTDVQSNTPAVPGNSPQNAQAPQPVPKTPALQQAATQKFGSYDEGQYNYVQAINPRTGQMDIGRIKK